MSTSIKAGLETYLRSLADLAALVDDRIYFGERPLGKKLPALTFFRTGGNSVQVAQGTGAMGVPKFGLSCWGRSGEEAESLAAVLRPLLDAFQTALMGGVWVAAARVDDLADDMIPPAHGENKSDHRVSLEITVWHDE